MPNKKIDQGQAFDWGKTSEDYGKYRDILPLSFYEHLRQYDIGLEGQQLLDLGTGTGVLPRGMYREGLHFTGIDVVENQIQVARKLAAKEGKAIQFEHLPAEEIAFPDQHFDAATAIQCWHYFDHAVLLPKLIRQLKPQGKLAIGYMHWLPEENELVKASEALILKYNPKWTSGGIARLELKPSKVLEPYFKLEALISYDEAIPFTRAAWLGRIRASRPIGASLSQKQMAAFDKEHADLIASLCPENFSILHQFVLMVYVLT